MSAIEIKIGNRTEPVEIIEIKGNKIRISLGIKEFCLDLVKVEDNIYSILLEGKSYDIEVAATKKKNVYSVRYINNAYNVEIVDAELRYYQNRLKSAGLSEENIISCPMPGKVVRVMVNEGDSVDTGDVVIVVSAMKMESEYKSGKTGKIKEVLVGEGDIIDANMPLIVLE